MIVAYTAAGPDKQVQCMHIASTKDGTFTKYTNNPVIDSKHIWNSHDTWDPKIFWVYLRNHWVMVLNERDGHSHIHFARPEKLEIRKPCYRFLGMSRTF